MSRAAERATILAVDDLPEYRRLYERRLGDGFEVVTAESGSEALERIGEQVDVVLLDRSMPDMSGDEVLETIRADGYDCRVAMVTANEPDDDVIDLGFDAYLVKPVTTAELTETVERLLARTAYEAHLQELYTLCVERAESRAPDRGVGVNDRATETETETEEADDELAALEDRIREIRDQVDETVGAFETADYRASFRDLPDLE